MSKKNRQIKRKILFPIFNSSMKWHKKVILSDIDILCNRYSIYYTSIFQLGESGVIGEPIVFMINNYLAYGIWLFF